MSERMFGENKNVRDAGRIMIMTDGLITFGPFTSIIEAAEIAERLGLGDDWSATISESIVVAQ